MNNQLNSRSLRLSPLVWMRYEGNFAATAKSSVGTDETPRGSAISPDLGNDHRIRQSRDRRMQGVDDTLPALGRIGRPEHRRPHRQRDVAAGAGRDEHGDTDDAREHLALVQAVASLARCRDLLLKSLERLDRLLREVRPLLDVAI